MDHITMKHIDNNFYRIADSVAGKLAKGSPSGKLPRHGYEIKVTLPDGRHGWLTRTAYSVRLDAPKRGWVWAVHITN